jgi:putative transposase
VIFGFIDVHQQEWPVAVMCDVLEVSTAGFYAWRTRPVSAGQERRDRLIAEIRVIHDTVQGERIKIHPNCCVELDSDK